MNKQDQLDLSFFRILKEQEEYKKSIDTKNNIQHNPNFAEKKPVLGTKGKAILGTLGLSTCLVIGNFVGLGAIKGISLIQALDQVHDQYGKPTISILDKCDFTLNGYEIDGQFVAREDLVKEKTKEIYQEYISRVGIKTVTDDKNQTGGMEHVQ